MKNHKKMKGSLMLYGNKEIQDEILEQVRKFERKHNKKVIFGAVVGSISKGLERYDSDYDTRFLYLDPSENGYVRWDRVEENIAEKDVHLCYIPQKADCYIDGDDYRDRSCELGSDDKSFFYDKIAFWEITSFVNFLRNPKLDNKFSIGLYHIVAWTLNSPYCWDPYGIKSKISGLLDQMFVGQYEIAYYRNYICNALNKSPLRLREYLYSAYYALAIEYCIKFNRFAPVYFKSLLVLCEDDKLENRILDLEKKYYKMTAEKLESGETYERKMSNSLNVEHDSVIDDFLEMVLEKTKKDYEGNVNIGKEKYVDGIIGIILDSLKRPIVRGVNDFKLIEQ